MTMRSLRLLPLALALCLLLPAALAAAQACGMVGCAMEPASAHDCCPQPEAQLAVDCCLEADTGAAETPQARAGAPALLVVPGPVDATAPPAVAAPPVAATAGPPPPDLLARLCVLRI